MARKRTAKSLGQRHDFHYFQRWGAWRLTRAILMTAIPAFAILWLVSYHLRGSAIPYSSGPLSSVHSFTGKQCNTCHAPLINAGVVKVGFRKHVSDDACLSCHQAPLHQAMQTFTPTCGSCHVEHIGSPHLQQTADQTCVQCHGDLKVKSGQPRYQTAIYNFNSQHPEFAPLRDDYRDPGTIKLNHFVHLRAGLLGPHAQPVQLECQDCHRTPADQGTPWKYGEARVMNTALDSSAGDPHNPDMPAEPIHPGAGRAYMAAPTYASACQSCHALQFDSHFSESVPHDRPEIVHAFVVKKLTDYIQQHPQALHEQIRPARMIFAGKISREGQQAVVARTPAEWVKLRTDDAENLLWHKACIQCHTLNYKGTAQTAEATPEVAPANIKPVWLKNAVFSHYAHVSIQCESCHAKAPTSQETADVLIPSIKTCQSCHNGQPTNFGKAQNGCFLCHQYHNWNERSQPFQPSHSIQELRGANDIHGTQATKQLSSMLSQFFVH